MQHMRPFAQLLNSSVCSKESVPLGKVTIEEGIVEQLQRRQTTKLLE